MLPSYIIALILRFLKRCFWSVTRHTPSSNASANTLSYIYLITSSFLSQSPEGDKNSKMAMANPERYVVKPQREGGGRYLLKFYFCTLILISRTSTVENI